jgi:hypothetical protein
VLYQLSYVGFSSHPAFCKTANNTTTRAVIFHRRLWNEGLKNPNRIGLWSQQRSGQFTSVFLKASRKGSKGEGAVKRNVAREMKGFSGFFQFF